MIEMMGIVISLFFYLTLHRIGGVYSIPSKERVC